MESQELEMRREACYTLSNILADKPEGHDSVFDNKILPILLQLLQYDNHEVNLFFQSTKELLTFFSKDKI